MGILNALRLTKAAARADDPSTSSPITIAPARPTYAAATPELALTISTVYRAIDILTTGCSQLSLDQWRGLTQIQPSTFIDRPDVDMTRSAFIEYTVASLALEGNAFWLIQRSTDGSIFNIKPINPTEVAIRRDPDTDRLTYHWRGRDITSDIKHLAKLRIPGRDRGLGPIEAARLELAGILDLRTYRADAITGGDIPSGILTTDQALSDAQAQAYRARWEGLDPDTGERDRTTGWHVRVLGNGLKYAPTTISPEDLQFLEVAKFDTTQVARLFGVPSSLMLATVDGNTQTYSNVEQDWIGFTRFTLMAYLREIEEAFTDLLPRGNRARFNIDALQRSDTLTRYQAHQIALAAGFLTLDEVRAIEGLAPLPTTAPTETQQDIYA